MKDGAHRRVVRIGDTVRRPAQPWTPTVHALLRHLENVGFAYVPRPLGIDEEGREVLTYIDGDSGASGWAKVVDDPGLSDFARTTPPAPASASARWWASRSWRLGRS